MSQVPAWIGAREARLYDLGDANGQRLVEWAAQGLIAARCRAVQGRGLLADADGRFPLPRDFWRGLVDRTGSAYRDWKGGTFRSAIKVGSFRDRPIEVEAFKVEFLLSDLDDMTDGRVSRSLVPITPDTRSPIAEVEDASAAAVTSKRQGKGGPKMANHAGPAIAVYLQLVEMRRIQPDQYSRATVESVSAMLADEYKRGGVAAPNPDNLLKQAAGVLQHLHADLA